MASDPSLTLSRLRIELTRACPLRCRHCSVFASPKQDVAWDPRLALAVVSEFASMGGRELTLTGGEPLVYEHLVPVVQHASSLGLEVVVFTSGVTGRENERLVTASQRLLAALSPHVARFVFSIYGDSQAHQAVTKAADSYQSLLDVVTTSAAEGIHCEFHFVPLKHNFERLPEVVAMAAELGVRRVRIIRFVPQGRGRANSERLAMEDEMTRRFLASVRLLRKAYPDVDLKLGSAFLRWTPDAGVCTAAVNELVLDPLGNAYPCSGFSGGGIHFGNVHKGSLQEVWWSSEGLRQVRQEVALLMSTHAPADCEFCPAQRAHRRLANHCEPRPAQAAAQPVR